jgi:hypothetical protein
LKLLFDVAIGEEAKPEEYSYLTKQNGNKQLILIKIPSLKRVQKSERTAVFKIVGSYMDVVDSLHTKELYLGIHGKINMMMVKTPTTEESSNFVSDDPLFEFYGPRPPSKKE